MKKQLIKLSANLLVALLSFFLIFKTALVVDLLFKSIGVVLVALLITNIILIFKKNKV